jgi:hypothetical protein
VSEQALAPTITEVSTSTSTINFTITNNDPETAVIIYETNDELPDENGIELAGGATSGTLTITNLTVSPAILYASANVVGKVKSNITEKSFTFTVTIYTAATGGTTLEYDDGGKRYKSHTFLDDGDFIVTTVGDATDDRNKVDYLIIAGGGAAGGGGGGGAGGYLTTLGATTGGVANQTKFTVTANTFGVVVGAGGATAGSIQNPGANGNVSSVFSVISTGGGGGGKGGSGNFNGGNGIAGGSGGAGSNGNDGVFTGGTGTSGQGTNGGNSATQASGGGGGAGQAGSNGTNPTNGTFDGRGGNGGDGLANLLRTGSNETRAGGGGGNGFQVSSGTGGAGGGGDVNVAGAVNTGSGGGRLATGGSGIVIIRYEIAPSV